MKLWVVALAALAAYLSVSYILAHRADNTENKSASAEALPKAFFYDADGKKYTLEDFGGRPLLVNLWATWCPPCVAELPSLDRLQAKLRDTGLKVLIISMDREGGPQPVLEFLRKHRIEHLVPYWDRDREIMMNWEHEGLPVSFLIARDGRLIRKYEGNYAWDRGDLLKAVEAAAK